MISVLPSQHITVYIYIIYNKRSFNPQDSGCSLAETVELLGGILRLAKLLRLVSLDSPEGVVGDIFAGFTFGKNIS